jgi:hypothetical protein
MFYIFLPALQAYGNAQQQLTQKIAQLPSISTSDRECAPRQWVDHHYCRNIFNVCKQDDILKRGIDYFFTWQNWGVGRRGTDSTCPPCPMLSHTEKRTETEVDTPLKPVYFK